MLQLLILASFCAVISAISLPTDAEHYPHNLGWLFSLDEKIAESKDEERAVCKTEECKMIAKVIKESMNDSVDPCEDFYEYACGNWPKNNPIPPGEESWSLWDMVGKNVRNHIKKLMELEPAKEDVLPIRLAKKWYNSCLDKDRIEEHGLEPLVSTLSRLGGWPLLMEEGEWNDHMYSWQKVDDHYARLTGVNTFHDVEVSQYQYEDDGNDNDDEDQQRVWILYGIGTPHLPPNSYKLFTNDKPESDGDMSDEEQNEDNSLEEGSEENRSKLDSEYDSDSLDIEDYEDNEIDDSDESLDIEDYEDIDIDDSYDYEIRKGAVSKKKHRIAINGRKRSQKTKVNKKQDGEVKTKKRMKRSPMKAKVKNAHRSKKNKQVHQRATKTAMHKSKSSKRNKVIINRVHPDWKKNHVKHNVEEKSDNSENASQVSDENNSKQNGNEKEGEDGSDEKKDEDDSDEKKHESDSDEKKGEDDSDEKNDEDDENNESNEDDDENSEENIAKNQERYKKYILNVALAIAKARGTEVPEEKLVKDIEDMVEFQTKLTKAVYRGSNLSTKTLLYFQEMYDSKEYSTRNGKVNWVVKIKRLFDEAGVELDENRSMVIECKKYMKALGPLLDETSTETIVNYIHWNFISRMLKASTKQMRELYNEWEGNDDAEENWNENCIDEMQLSNIVGYEYVRKHFPDEIRQTASDMIDDIQKEVEYQIKESTWMDDETKDFILDKLVNMKNLVGYPDWYKNTTYVKSYFSGLTIGPSHYENILSYNRYFKWKNLQLLDEESVDDSPWDPADPVTLNAFFLPTDNSITITAADFQSPFFAFRRPWHLNFGIIGFVMAHEVNHGFDDTGHLYNRKGQVMEWLSAMANAYNKRAECFVDQFNKYSILKSKNLTLNHFGNQTAGENIADTMGLQAVYRAYRRRERECGKEEDALPGFEEFSNDQLFFLSFASLWCENANPLTSVLSALFDVHSPGRLRVIGSVSNSEDFARAYNCPLASPMNPVKKCNIWK